MNKVQLILASKSPRRREILENLGLEFLVLESEADESSISPEGLEIKTYVQELALLKAADCVKRVLSKNDVLVISADTVVSIDGKILGKPKNEEDAYSMLKSLSGKMHTVYTGFCVMRGSDAKCVCDACATNVTFKELSDDEISAYIKTKEPMDKAGAYGIQGLGALLVSEISGDYLNVVGLPASRLSEVLKNEFDYYIIKE